MKSTSTSTANKLSTDQEAAVKLLLQSSANSTEILELMNKSDTTWDGVTDFEPIVATYKRYVSSYIAANKQKQYLTISTAVLAAGLVVTGVSWAYMSRGQMKGSAPARR